MCKHHWSIEHTNSPVAKGQYAPIMPREGDAYEREYAVLEELAMDKVKG